MNRPGPKALSGTNAIQRWGMLALGLAFVGIDLLGLLDRMAMDSITLSTWAFLLLGAYGAILYPAVTLERGKSAPALRSKYAPWIALACVQIAARLAGAAHAPFLVAHALLVLFVTRQHGMLQGALLGLLALGLEGAALRRDTLSEGLVLGVAWSLAGLPMAWVAGWVLSLGTEKRSGAKSEKLRIEEAGFSPAHVLAEAEELPTIDPGDLFWRNAASIVDLAWHAHPHWNSATLWWMDGDKASLRLHRMRQGQARIDAEIGLDDGMVGLAMKEQKAIAMATLSAESAGGLGYYDGEAPARALIAVPLLDEGVVRGVLAIDRVEAGLWPPQEESALEFSARQLVQLWQQSAAFGRVQAQGKRTSRLYEVAKVLASDLDRERLLTRFPDLLASLVPFDSYVLALREGEQGEFGLAAKRGYRANWDGGKALAVEGVVGRFVGQSDEAVVFNAGADAQVPPFLIEGLESPADCFMLVPLNLAGRFSGLLKIDRRGRAFTAAERDIALIFANQAALTLEHARLYTLHRRMATTDGLTGLYNHRYFQERLALELEKAGREHGSVALALTDIDFFKKFNDTFGHQEGDVVLKKVARLLEDKARPGKDVVCRYGGEEFVVIMPGCDIVEAREVMDALRDYCAKNMMGGTGPEARAITMSIGLSVFPQGAQDQRELIHLADEALYKAKKSGRNQVCSYKDLS